MDGTAYTDIFEADQNIHEGWNYMTWPHDPNTVNTPTSYQSYRYYRFSGPEAHTCLMNEISFTGVETIDNNSPQIDCDVNVHMGSTVHPIVNKVTYSGN